MPFNPTHTFQKNRRFWMAAILMICMISFVFCTGMKGDMAERFGWLIGRRGTVVAVVGNRNVTSQDLYDLRTQRNVANEFMRNCTEIAFKKVSKFAFEKQREPDDKNLQARQQALAQLFQIQGTLYERKAKPRYFSLGVKFDDLLEFKLWQAVADKLDIRLDEKHVDALLRFEFFSHEILDDGDLSRAQNDTRRNFQNINDAYMRRAIGEEFRVRIAQEAVLMSQPFRAFTQRQQDGFSMKFTSTEMPDEIRAPLTLAQLWEAYKAQRSEFNVTLVPVHVDDFLKEIKDEPNDLQKAEHFRLNKDKPADPGAEDRGLQLPMRVKIEYVIADPTSKEYLGVAKTLALLTKVNPVYLDAVQSPLAAAYGAMERAEKHRLDMKAQYDNITRPTDTFDYRAAPFSSRDAASPILTWLAKRHPEAAASMIANGFSGPANDMGALAGYMAWGALKHPQEVDESMKAEAKRRAPAYATIIGNGATDPLAALGGYFGLDLTIYDPDAQRLVDDGKLNPGQQYIYRPRELPLEAAMHEMEEKMAVHAAEESVQQNMQTLRGLLEKDGGDEQKYRRILNEYVPKLNLTYGPAKKDVYFSRFSVDDAKELAPLKESYLKYINLVNLFEARDMTPERLLKPGDFYKMFFDPSESFAATTPYHAMPWPPKAKPSTTRMWKGADPRLIDSKQIREKDFMNFKQQLEGNDPLKPLPELDLFKDAEKPILFWRTGERIPERPGDYADIDRNLKKYQADWIKAGDQAKKMEEISDKLIKMRKQQADWKKAKDKEADLKAITEKVAGLSTELRNLEKEAQGSAGALRARQIDLKEKEADLEEVKRMIVEGWRFERARTEKALPRAQTIAEEFLNPAQQKTKRELADAEAVKLNRARIELPGLAPMHRDELADKSIDYFKTPLPKNTIPFARDDMMEQAVRLINLKEPVKIDNKALDDINKMLFDKARAKKNPEGEYVQILTNKARSVFYVAVVTLPPQADRMRFNIMMRGTYNFLRDPGERGRAVPRDHFAERIQQQDAKVFRAEVVQYLGQTLGFRIEKEDAKKDFDDRGGGD